MSMRNGFAALSLAAMLLLLAACGGEDSPDEAGATDEPAATAGSRA